MTRHVVWQVGLALLGIALVFAILLQVAASQVIVVQPAAGGKFVEGVLGYASIVNPILTSSGVQANSVSEDVAALVFEGLTTLDDQERVSPALATNWELNEDGTVIDFHLRSGVSWQDGAPFTASDVMFTIQAIQDPQFQGDPALQGIWRSVVAERVDDLTVRLTLAEPFPSFIYYTTIGILPAHLLSDVPAADLPMSEFSTSHPIGTGRYMVESISSERIVLEANLAYWGQKPFLQQVEFWSFGDEDALLASYERGEIDGFRAPRSKTLSDLSQLDGLQLLTSEQAGYSAILLNLARSSAPFFQTLEVRQALIYGLDRQALIDTILGGQGLVASSPLPPLMWAHDSTVRHYPYDPERAAGLLDASGWLDTDGDRIRDKQGVRLSFELLTGSGLVAERMADQIAAQWRAIGVEATIRQVSLDELDALLRGRTFDAALADIALSADPDPYALWHSTQASGAGQNITGFGDEEADLAMEVARSTADLELQAASYSAFQQRFAELVPALLLYYPVSCYAVSSEIHGVQLSPQFRASDRFRNIADWYRETSEKVVTGDAELDNSEK